MIPFSEKLSFLLYITETSNKELATALSVDASMISLMRTGKRKLSKNPEQARKIAVFFAKRCTAAFQRQALSEMLGKISISPNMPTEVLESHLEKWLLDKEDFADTVLSNIQAICQDDKQIPSFSHSSEPTRVSEEQTLFFTARTVEKRSCPV